MVAHSGNRKEFTSNGESEKGKTNSKIRGKGVRCYHCKKIGHVKKNCPHRKSTDNEDDHVGNVNTIIEDLLTFSKDKIAYSQDWIIDSSFALHMLQQKIF